LITDGCLTVIIESEIIRTPTDNVATTPQHTREAITGFNVQCCLSSTDINGAKGGHIPTDCPPCSGITSAELTHIIVSPAFWFAVCQKSTGEISPILHCG
jgi:hypothetical protein